MRFAVREKHARPVVVVCGKAFAKSNRHAFEIEFFGQLLGDGYVTVSVEFARIYVRIIRFDSENVFRVFFVRYAIIDI